MTDPAQISPFIWVVYHVRHEGREAMQIGNFQVDRLATDEEILADAVSDIEAFYIRHMPEGTPRPKVVNFIRGALRLSVDDEE